ncbi:hypothetical protein ACGFNU_38470 [Spirillospora sp. NPDC048911]
MRQVVRLGALSPAAASLLRRLSGYDRRVRAISDDLAHHQTSHLL